MKINAKKLEELISVPLFYLDTTPSTNTYAKEICQNTSSPFLVVAESQSAGRGRMGRSFYSGGEGIYMSFCFPTDSLQNSVCVTVATAAAVTKAFIKNSRGDFKIKWVNDIFLNEKKVCGILCESVAGQTNKVIVGVGINVGECDFPDGIKDIAGSVNILSSPEELISDVVRELLAFEKNPLDRSYMSLYREHFMLEGETIEATIGGKSVIGTVLGVEDDGGLILQVCGQENPVTIISGEVSVRRKKSI